MHRTRISDTTQALIVALRLLSIVSLPPKTVDSYSKRGSKADKGVVTKPTWAVDCFRTLWYTMTINSVDLAIKEPLLSCIGLFLISLSDIMSRCSERGDRHIHTSQVAILLSQSVAMVMQVISEDIVSSLEHALCSALLQFLFLRHGPDAVQEAFCEHLLPKILEIVEEDQLEKMSTDLKVCSPKGVHVRCSLFLYRTLSSQSSMCTLQPPLELIYPLQLH